jgi:hypothetical protein
MAKVFLKITKFSCFSFHFLKKIKIKVIIYFLEYFLKIQNVFQKFENWELMHNDNSNWEFPLESSKCIENL